MRRRGFLQLAGAAVLGVLTAKVPVFAEELNAYAKAPRGLVNLIDSPPGSMYVYPSQYALRLVKVGEEVLAFTQDFDLVDPAGSLPGRAWLASAKCANYREERRWNVHSSRGYVPPREGGQ